MNEPAHLRFDHRADCVVIQVQGRDIVERMVPTMQAIAAAIEARPVRAALIDFRQVPKPLTFLDRFQLGVMAGRHLPRIPLGALVREDQADPKRIGQLAAQNRGAHVEIFLDEAQAGAWLTSIAAGGRKPPATSS